MKAFAEAISEGLLNNIVLLHLNENTFGNKGINAFAGALAKGAMSNLIGAYLQTDDNLWHRGELLMRAL